MKQEVRECLTSKNQQTSQIFMYDVFFPSVSGSIDIYLACSPHSFWLDLQRFHHIFSGQKHWPCWPKNPSTPSDEMNPNQKKKRTRASWLANDVLSVDESNEDVLQYSKILGEEMGFKSVHEIIRLLGCVSGWRELIKSMHQFQKLGIAPKPLKQPLQQC